MRKCIETICLDKSAVGNSLPKKIEDLGERGVIPQTLSAMATIIKNLGNIGAHSEKIEIDYHDRQSIEDFFLAIVEYVYIAPAKLEKLKVSMSGKKESFI